MTLASGPQKEPVKGKKKTTAVLVKEGMTEIFEMGSGAKNPSKLYLLKKLWSHRM